MSLFQLLFTSRKHLRYVRDATLLQGNMTLNIMGDNLLLIFSAKFQG